MMRCFLKIVTHRSCLIKYCPKSHPLLLTQRLQKRLVAANTNYTLHGFKVQSSLVKSRVKVLKPYLMRLNQFKCFRHFSIGYVEGKDLKRSEKTPGCSAAGSGAVISIIDSRTANTSRKQQRGTKWLE